MAGNRNFGYTPSIKNFECLRCMSFWAGGLAVAQSLVLMVLCIIAILSYNCIMPVDSNLSIGSLMDTLFFDMYFRGHCIPNGFNEFNHTMLNVATPVLDSEQMLVWVCVYLGIIVCWLLASVVLVTDLNKNKIKKSLVLLHGWNFFTFCVCAMDLALAIMFAVDFARYQAKAYGFNLNSSLSGMIDENSSLLVGAMVVSASMMIISLKGFTLWIINVGFIVYFTCKAVCIAKDKDNHDTLFNPSRKESNDILTTDEITVQGEIIETQTYNNDAFIPDYKSVQNDEVDPEPLYSAANAATVIQETRFRNLDSYQQYPPPKDRPRQSAYMSNNSNSMNNMNNTNNLNNSNRNNNESYPNPDYSPPMGNNRRTLY